MWINSMLCNWWVQLVSMDLFETKFPHLFILKNIEEEIHIMHKWDEIYLWEFKNWVFMSNLYSIKEVERIEKHIDRLWVIKNIIQNKTYIILSMESEEIKKY